MQPVDLDRSEAATSLVTIAGSAGAFPVLWQLVAKLPTDLKAAVAIVLHTGPGSILATTLSMRSSLVVLEASSGDLLQDGNVYVPPPQSHLVVNADARLTVSHAPRIQFFRPSADWLFESAAASFPNRHVAVVLSGMLWDGAGGPHAVKRAGGMVLVQDPSDAACRDMPRAAIATGCVDRVVPSDEMADAICDAVAAQESKRAAALSE